MDIVICAYCCKEIEEEYAVPVGEKYWCGLCEQEEEEEFGEPNAAYCQSIEPGHNGGWFCYHPDCVTSHDEGLCEGCHRKEEICICGGIPEGF